MLKCDYCGKSIKDSAGILLSPESEQMLAFCYKGRCFVNGIDQYFKVNQGDFVWAKRLSIASSTKREPIGLALRLAVFKRDKFKCVYYGSDDRLEVDHIIPVASGGKKEQANLQTLCFKCNRGKGAK